MRFQKRIQLLPWVHLNISASGFSLSFGPPGFSINVGKKGTRVTAGIPGTGLSTSHLFASPKTEAGGDVLGLEAHHPGIDFTHLPPPPEYDDPLYRDAVSIFVYSRRVSVTLLTRRLAIGYARAAALIQRMESDGIVTPLNSQGHREVVWLGMSPLEASPSNVDTEVLLKERRFAEWLENYLDPLSVNASPIYALGVAATLVHQRFGSEFLEEHLNVTKQVAQAITELMIFDGITPSNDDPLKPISRMDAGALWKSFELYDNQNK